jgi:hypothetical protein
MSWQRFDSFPKVLFQAGLPAPLLTEIALHGFSGKLKTRFAPSTSRKQHPECPQSINNNQLFHESISH